MPHSFEKPRDVIGGLAIMAIGAGFLMLGRVLPFGTAVRMGPGYFPSILSVLLFALGAIIAGLALRSPSGASATKDIAWRGVGLVVGSVILFGLTMRGLGLAPVLVIVVLAAAFASQSARLRTAMPLALGLSCFCALLFIKALGLSLPLVGPWLTPGFWQPAAIVNHQ
ncbi:tripartite tricarboxylate transporter TctB family protein [Mesorhizobium sp.]|uniref:tripartite tricarboxylate transporter TctB family protein n=1 Tax=Mesorhizobium sp. TaxID=1871066 RepID=UPI000FE6B1A4|nr:tripartite tricarboxylate transporter TctB family protein [Mesorhizobium sp.]RWJ05768.1 MAG: tripartite tricarboxylate transporter TctB family protein [Mesorhizobium sp.]